MKRLYETAIALLLMVPFTTMAQDHDCGTHLTPESYNHILELRQGVERLNQEHFRILTHQVPVQIHVVRKSDGTGGVDFETIIQELDLANDLFAEANIEFYVSRKVNYIDNSAFYDLNKQDEGKLAGPNDVAGALNLYYTNTIFSGSNQLAGFTYYPGSNMDRVFISGLAAGNGSTLAHEFGHYFGLLHTHGMNGIGAEAVAGNNCSDAGDLICDTPADPNLRSTVDQGCNYFGTARDANGDFYNPDTRNIMSYAPDYCRSSFTYEQMTMMVYTLQTSTSHLEVNDNFIPVSDVYKGNVAISQNIDISVYPNPTFGGVQILLNERMNDDNYFTVTVMDVRGSTVYETLSNGFSNSLQVDFSGMEKGLYLVQVMANDRLTTERVIYQ